MRWVSLLWLCSLCGCAGGPTIGAGVLAPVSGGDSFGITDGFDEVHGGNSGETTDLSFDYESDPPVYLGAFAMWDFDTPRERVLDGPVPPPFPGHNSLPEEPEEEDQFATIVNALLVIAGALGLYGGQRTVRVIERRRKEKANA